MVHRSAWALAFVVGMSGCYSNSLGNVRAAHAGGAGTTRVLEGSEADARAATEDILRVEPGVQRVQHESGDRSILAEKEGSVFPPRSGGYIGVWVEPSGSDHCKVTVVTENGRGEWLPGMTEGGFLDRLEGALRARRGPGASGVADAGID
jgi:hypothetical protein